MNSDPAVLLQVKTLQVAIQAAKENRGWEDEGFELIAQGAAGSALKGTLDAMREQRVLHRKITAHGEPLKSAAAGLWQDLSTSKTNLAAAIAFQKERRAIVEEGRLEQDHELIATGKCGPTLRAEHNLLEQRANNERTLKEFADLRDLAAGLWTGLHTKTDVALAAVNFQGHIATAVSQLARTPDEITSLKSALTQLLGDGNALLESQGLVNQYGRQYLASVAQLKNSLDRLASTGHFSNDGS